MLFFLPLQAGELASHSETRMKEIQQEISAIDQELVRLGFRFRMTHSMHA